MDDQPPKGNGLKSGLTGKLALLLGSGLALINGTSTTTDSIIAGAPTTPLETIITSSNKRLNIFPAKLVLRQYKSGFKMIAQHDSHASHSSHSSHNSHNSHNSHSSHSSHDSHTSHTSHVSGGFV